MSYFRLNATIGLWYFVVSVFVLRLAQLFKSVQSAMHKIGPKQYFAMVFQWYNLWYIGSLFFVCYSYWELATQYHSQSGWFDMTEERADEIFAAGKNTQEDWRNYFNRTVGAAAIPAEVTAEYFRRTMKVDPWLKVLWLCASLTCPVTLGISAVHIYKKLILPGHEFAKKNDLQSVRDLSWMPFRRSRFLLLIFMMPTVFLATGMRSSIRIWALVTGVAEGWEHRPWAHVHRIELAMYTNDMEVANFLQFFSVYAFARLCGLFITEFTKGDISNVSSANLDANQVLRKELKMVIRWPAFLGVWAFFLFGMLESLLTFISAELMQWEKYKQIGSDLQLVLDEKVSMILGVFTILAVINMVLISNMSMVKSKLGNVNMKFNGARLIILVSTIQEKIIRMFTASSPMFEDSSNTKKLIDDVVHYEVAGNISFTDAEARLLHVSLLFIESLFVVMWNVWFWRDFDLGETGVLRSYAEGLNSSEADDDFMYHDAFGEEEDDDFEQQALSKTQVKA
jgi:hypothetical protein